MRTPGRSLPYLFEIMDCLVDEHIGIIRHVIESQRQAGDPDFFCFSARTCDTSVLSSHRIRGAPGGIGASSERSIAMAKAVGEAVERYCSTLYAVEDLPLVSFQSASFPCVPPGEFTLYSREQYSQPGFPYAPFENTTCVRWTPALDLMNGTTLYVPAARVFLPYVCSPESGEPTLSPQISTGLACHTSLAMAAVSAICEVIERDAFTITWQAMMSRPQIRLETLSEDNRGLIGRFEQIGSAVSLLDITMDHGVPSILSVLRNKAAERPALLFALSAHLDPEEAVRKSLEELSLLWQAARRVMLERPTFVPGPNWENVVDQDSHLDMYCRHVNSHWTDFLFKSHERVAFHEIENLSTGSPDRDLQVLGEKISAVNHRVLLADVTSEDVRDLGLSVVRAVIPGFHPLFIGHRNRALGGTRLWQVPQTLGYPGITRESGDNPAPHPLS